ncbi:MAG: LytR C-terminal domain-containing protein [Candidatus Berkelbacteria bacterium]|nr:MAG: LytR C-terminal domain-containing protein [Candidatus Berkelbacteria bacterium]QQG51401.1 MAG: LytR C-terminal domain-containing protein [Candidatus Berkelbacteria bacterium]
MLMLVVGLGLAAVGLFASYYNSSSDSVKPTTTTDTPVTSDEPSGNSADVFSNKNTAFEVKIYDSGAGDEAVDSTTALLTEKGYTVKKLGKSQFVYDKTYIWHIQTRLSEAQTIGALLQGREVSYKESQNSGGFELLIYLGKQ